MRPYALFDELIYLIGLGVVFSTSALLFVFGVNLLHLSWRASRLRPIPARRTPRR